MENPIICGIYAIKNIKNNKIYIGKTINAIKRFASHKTLLKNNKHFNICLQNSYNKHGIEYFEYCILEECSKNLLSKKEQYWIDENDKTKLFNHVVYVENLTNDRNPFFGKKHTEKTKKHLSKLAHGKYVGEKNPNYGKKWSQQQKNRMAVEHPNTKLTPLNVLEIKNLLIENNLSDEQIAQKYQISRSVVTRIATGSRWTSITGGRIRGNVRGKRNIGIKRSENTKNKISLSLTGIKRSEETKQKISLAKRKKI